MAELPLVSPIDRALFLRAQPHLAGLEPSVVVALARHTRERRYRSGETLFREDEMIRCVSFLAEGSVAIQRGGRTLFEVSAPGGVGFAFSMAQGFRTPTCVAQAETLVLEIELDTFLRIMEDHFELVLQMARILSRLLIEAGLAPNEAGYDAPWPEPGPTLNLVERLAFARRFPVFQRTDLTVLSELLRGDSEMRLEPGEWLWKTGERPEAVLLVVQGALRLDGAVSEPRAGPGAMLGFEALFSGWPHRHGVVAETRVAALRVERSLYMDVIEDHFDIAQEVLCWLATRYVAWQEANAPRAGTVDRA